MPYKAMSPDAISVYGETDSHGESPLARGLNRLEDEGWTLAEIQQGFSTHRWSNVAGAYEIVDHLPQYVFHKP